MNLSTRSSFVVLPSFSFCFFFSGGGGGGGGGGGLTVIFSGSHHLQFAFPIFGDNAAIRRA